MSYKIINVDGDEIKVVNSKIGQEEVIDGRTFNLLYKYGIRFKSNSSLIVDKLNRTKNGTCLYLRINLKTIKVVFVGRKKDTFIFYDGQGVDGFIEIKSRYILKSNNIYIDFDCEQDRTLKESLKENLNSYFN